MIKITVPATSANLGIGYDTLGMAVSLYSHFTIERADELQMSTHEGAIEAVCGVLGNFDDAETAV